MAALIPVGVAPDFDVRLCIAARPCLCMSGFPPGIAVDGSARTPGLGTCYKFA